jgi:hypothetical protein
MPTILLTYLLTFSRITVGFVFAASSIGKMRKFPAFLPA